MIQKAFVNVQGRKIARVTFTLPDSVWADKIYLVGDFNGWNRVSHPLRRDREGRWFLTVELDLGRAYQFLYLRDGQDWMNDGQADAYTHNTFGNHSFVVITDPNFKQYCD
jgi:1,4-alpha-glucan branching enzyme